MTANDLKNIRSMGPKSVAEIEEKLVAVKLPETHSKNTELKSCPFCGGMISCIDRKRSGLEIRTKATCTKCWMEFSYVQDFAYSKTRGQVVPFNASFEEAWNRRVGDGLLERMMDDGK